MPETLSFTDDHAALQWLYETQMFGVKLGLGNVRKLLLAMDLPGQSQRFIHVAGTNGKGSVCAFAHQLLTTAGYTAGIFTSPHLVRFNERIRDGSRMISGSEIAEGLSRIRSVIECWDPHPTFFEITLALALDWFRQRKVHYVVLETGLGGRMDATNVVHPVVSVITSIGMDHTEVLGDTLTQIAGEKAGIIKSGIPVVTGWQKPEVLGVLRDVAALEGADFVEVSKPWQISQPSLPGEHQRQNAALAVAAVRAVGVEVGDDLCALALGRAYWPGRFQRFGVEGKLVIDGAHNTDSARALAKTWREVFADQQAHILLGVVHGKDLDGILTALTPICAEWHVAPFQSPRAINPQEMEGRLRDTGRRIRVHKTLPTALQCLEDLALPSLVAGSLFLAGEALNLLTGGQGFEPSWQ